MDNLQQPPVREDEPVLLRQVRDLMDRVDALERRPSIDDLRNEASIWKQAAEAANTRADELERKLAAKDEPPPVEVEAEADPENGVPDEFRALMLEDEPPERFTLRMKNRLQALKHLQIDGTKPTNARALPDMTEEEIAELADLEARNLKSGNWLG